MLYKLFVILASPLYSSDTHTALTSIFIRPKETPSVDTRAPTIYTRVSLIIPYSLSSAVINPAFLWT